MELVVIMCGVVVLFLAAYRIVGRYLERQLEVDDTRVTPATSRNDGIDYVPTKPAILFGHHFSSIAGAGPIVGPILAGLAFGWGPALLWIVVGAALVGGVHDFSSLMASLRHDGQSVGQVCKRYLSPMSYYLMLTFIWVAMIYVLIVFLDLTASSYAPAALAAHEQGGAVATASMLYIAMAVVFGFLVYRWNVPLAWASAVFVPLVFLAVWAGILMPWTAERVPALFGSAKNTWCAVLLVYCFLASILPVWVMLQPRDYLSAYLLVTCLVGGVAGVVVAGVAGRLEVQYPMYIGFKDAGLGYLYPAMFITIACGAMSGFHSIVASGTTSKQIASERDARPVAYGGMLTEGVLAVVALASVMILAGKPAGLSPTMIFGNGIGTFVGVFGVDPKIGTTFGVLAVSTFLLTTLDTCTRLGRFILQELSGLSGAAGRYAATAATLAIPAVLVFVQVKGEPAWRVVWPAFGATNQLLGALALLAVFAWLKYHGRRTVYVFVPMVFMAVTTMAALVQLISQKLAGHVTALDMFVGVVSLLLALLAVVLFGNTFWRLYRVRPVTEKI